jgi:high-affinity iron transporter
MIVAKTRVLVAMLVALVGTSLILGVANAAGGPVDDLHQANALVQEALAAARSGDIAAARQSYSQYENTWFDIEDGIRGTSRDSYVAIEKDMSAVTAALAATPPDEARVVAALTALDAEQRQFLGGNVSASTAPAPGESPAVGASTAAAAATGGTAGKPTVATLLDELSDARAALATGDYVAAAARMNAFQSTWLEVEGEIKTRSADAYRATETDMALAATLAAQGSPDTLGVVDRMATRLDPYRDAGRYGIFDAAIILLREGLEALLVIAALSAVLKKSETPSGQSWLWIGALAGLCLSILLGLAIQAFFGTIVNPANRELMEGVVGLFAAAMLIYISYWLHSKASIAGWQKYINTQTRGALKGGSLVGIGVLAFLAVFREGAETALFYLGMVGNISTSDLLTGLAIGFGSLAILGYVLVVAGVRIPMRPFFAIASVLVFYLCFKFIGTGIHSLQVSGFVPSATDSLLPSLDALGLYPTWPTTIAQLLLLGLAAWVLLRNRVSRPARAAGLAAVGALVLGTAFMSSPRTAAPAVPVATVLPPAPVLTNARDESRLVAAPRVHLEQAASAVQNNDLARARSAMDAYSADWNGIEVYVNFRSRDLYGEIESHYEADVDSALNAPDPDPAQILPLLQGMVAKYDEAIRLSDSGQTLSPMFDDLATLRTVRAPLRTVGAALQAGDTDRASTAFAEFTSRWPTAQPLFARYAPAALDRTTVALDQTSAAMVTPSRDAAPAVAALLASYNDGVTIVNDAARAAGYQTN